MIRSLTLALPIALIAGTVFARDCRESSGDVLVVKSWNAEAHNPQFGGEGAKITIVMENKTPSAIRMIDATIFFDDILGRSLVNLGVDEDASIAAGAEFTQSGSYQSYGGDIARLPQIKTEDAVVTICVTALVNEDGSVQRFDDK